LSCALCHTRKEKRFCPAIHDRICAVCCGREREVTLDCPSECPYLQQARRHEKPRRLEDLDQTALFPDVVWGEEFFYQQESLVGSVIFAVGHTARVHPELRDQDAIVALTAMAKSRQTLVDTGLHYQAPAASAARQAMVAEIEKLLSERRQAEQNQHGYSSLRDSDVLKALVFVLRLAHVRTSGRPKSRAFLDFLRAQFPEKQLAGTETAGRLITL